MLHTRIAKHLLLSILLSLFLTSFCYAIPVQTPLNVFNAIKHDLAFPFGKHTHSIHSLTQNKFENTNQTKRELIPRTIYTGLGKGLGDYKVEALYPDIDAHVGRLQLVETVNYDLAVFDKKTGKLHSGFPQPNNALWKGFGGPCEMLLGKNSMVKYDQLAHRWIIAQISQTTFCVAMSSGEDATGSYHRYSFDLKESIVNGKLGLWPNALYLSFDVVDDKQKFINVLACALDRNKMITGDEVTIQCKSVPKDFYTLVHIAPADLDGPTLPSEPARPGYFVGLTAHVQNPFDSPIESEVFFKYYVDFVNPSRTVLEYIYLVDVGYLRGMKQAAEPGGLLDVSNNGDLIFNRRVVYRQFLGFGSLLISFPDGATDNGIQQRWREYRFYAAQPIPVLYQISNNDSGSSYSRYAGNIATDKVGNIVIVNNISTFSINPSIELHARYISSPLGQLPYNQSLLVGKGAQISNPNKWGTYSALSIDPVDNCTFWSVNEYLKETGSLNWSTAIIKFKLSNCK